MASDKVEFPILEMLNDDEIAQAICNFTARRNGIDPDSVPVNFKVSYRNMKQPDGTSRLFASIVILGAEAPKSLKPEESK